MRKRIPPYVTFRTFKGFLYGLRKAGIPTRIDRSVLGAKSGSAKSQLLSCLFYLGLISDNDIPAPDLKRLVNAEETDRPEVLRGVIKKAYRGLFELDIKKATTEQVQKAFEREGLNSHETIRKALNFFCLAAKEAGIELSGHIKPYAGRKQSSRKNREVPQQGDFAMVQPRFVPNTRDGYASDLIAKFPEFNPAWPPDYVKNWLEAFRQLLKILKEEDVLDDVSSLT